jgi:chemotaxis-related protein WspB
MLFLLFLIGKDTYALDAGQVAEVLPLMSIKQIPRSPRGIAGAINYHGAPVPVIDLSELMLGRRAPARLSTRIILALYSDEHGEPHLLGLIAEGATEFMRRDSKDFVSSGITNDAAPDLGPVAADPRGLIQWIDVEKLLPPCVRDLLFKQPVEN